MTVWVISDTHFNHTNILNFTKSDGTKVRPFSSLKEMDECMMDNWNEAVRPGDKVYHLGDVLFGVDKLDWMQNKFRRLHGRKRLLVGNHDNPTFLSSYFDKVMLWRMFPEKGLLLTHVPVHQSTLSEGRFEGKPMLNVHGHIHANKSPEGPYKCVCVEQTDYKPVNLEDLTAA